MTGGLARVARAAAAILAAALGLAVAAVPAAALTGDPPQVTVAIAQYGPTVLRANANLEVTATLTNASAAFARPVVAELRSTDEPLASRDDASAWLAGESSPAVSVAERQRVGGTRGIAPEATVSVSLDAKPRQLGFPRDTTGVYGIEVAVRVGTEWTVQRALATWYDADVAPQPMVVIATVSGPDERAKALMLAAARTQITLVVDPTSLGPDSTGLAPGNRDAFILPAGNVDVASLAAAESPQLLDRALSASRTMSEPGMGWVAVVPALDPGIVAFARRADVSALLLDVEAGAEPGPALGYAPGSVPVAQPDPRLSDVVAKAGPTQPLSASRVAAESLLLALETGSAPVVVAPGVRWVVGGETSSPIIATLLDAPWTAPVTLSEALDTWDVQALTIEPAAASDTAIPSGVIAQAGSALEAAAATAATSVDPTGVIGTLERNLLRAMSYEGRLDTEARSASINAAIDALNAVRNSVAITGATDLNLVSSSGDLPVTVRNALDSEVTVLVVAASAEPNLVIDEPAVATIPARSEVQVFVPAHGVASADVDVTLWLADETLERISPTTAIRVRVRAQWGDTFTVAVAGAFVLLLTAGVIRTVRRGRRDTREAPTDEASALDNG